MAKKLTLNVDIPVQVLLPQLVEQLTDDELYRFIIGLDWERSDWAFTLRLWRFFDKERRKYDQEVKDGNL